MLAKDIFYGSRFMRTVQQLEQSLMTSYAAFDVGRNPVLHALGEATPRRAQAVASQYALLPARIVEILGAMAFRLSAWSKVHEELLENIAQECGSMTRGRAHFTILRDCLRNELGIDTNASCEAWPESLAFLDKILESVHTGDKEFIAGMAYALEASAVPELTVVAELVNRIARILGAPHDIVSRHRSSGREYAEQVLRNRSPEDYTLEDFLVVHLHAIEVEHRDGLQRSVNLYLASDEERIRLFSQGFEHLLGLMEKWWSGLAIGAASDPGYADPRAAGAHPFV